MEEHTQGAIEVVKEWSSLIYAAFIVGCSWTAVALGLKTQKDKINKIEETQEQSSEKLTEIDVKLADLHIAIVNVQKEYIDSKKDIVKLYVEFEKHKKEVRSIVFTEDNALRFVTYPAHDIMQDKCHKILREILKRHEQNIERVDSEKKSDKEDFMTALHNVSIKVDTLIGTVGELKGALHK